MEITPLNLCAFLAVSTSRVMDLLDKVKRNVLSCLLNVMVPSSIP